MNSNTDVNTTNVAQTRLCQFYLVSSRNLGRIAWFCPITR